MAGGALRRGDPGWYRAKRSGERGFRMGRFEGKVAVVTGGARGQGRSHARGLSAEGAPVAGWGIANGSTTRPAFRMARAEAPKEPARLIKEGGGGCLPVTVDLRDSSQ